MNAKYRSILYTVFVLLAVATVVVYFASDKNMTLTWIFGGLAIVTYLIYKFFGIKRN